MHAKLYDAAVTSAVSPFTPRLPPFPRAPCRRRLKFRNRVPQTLVAVRDFQLTQARGKMVYKALDAVIMTYRTDPETVRRAVAGSRAIDRDEMREEM